MTTVIDLTGRRFGRLIVVSHAGISAGRSPRHLWLCLCDCGSEVSVRGTSLQSGTTKSCGCLFRECATEVGRSTRRHGHATPSGRSPTYASWQSMLYRCTNPNATDYRIYGGSGITICQRWRDSFEAFLEDMGERPPGTSLDRWPNGRGNYEPGNCRWATAKEQAQNISAARLITIGDRTQCVTAWSEELGISPATVFSRLNRGWDGQRALLAPIDKQRSTRTRGVAA